MTQYKDFQILVRAEFDQNSEKWTPKMTEIYVYCHCSSQYVHLLKWENDNIDW